MRNILEGRRAPVRQHVTKQRPSAQRGVEPVKRDGRKNRKYEVGGLRTPVRRTRRERRGIHHEIYLGDPRRSKPENLRTIVRQPMG